MNTMTLNQPVTRGETTITQLSLRKPDVGTLRELARTLKRWGTCRLVESEPDDPQPFHLQVRPAIVEIVGEQWLQRLDQHNRDDEAEAADGDDVMEDGDAAA